MMTAMNNKVRRVALTAAVLAAVGCVNEDPVYIGPEICPPAETGYLTMSSIGLYVVVDSETDQETEQSPATMSTRADGAPTDAKTGITRGSEAAKEDEYIVTITSRDAAEPVFRGSYAKLKAAIAANEKGMEVPVGMYDISATSNLSVAGAPDDVQASPSYAGAVDGISVAKDVATQVETVVCKLQNIKITVGVSADLYEELEALDPETDPAKKIEAKVYYGDKENPEVEWNVPDNWDWTDDNAKAVYFPVLDKTKNNTLHFSFRAKTKGGKPITMTKDISGILKGQWRRIHVIPHYDTTGNLTFDVTVSSFVQDETIVIGDDGAAVAMCWSELPYVDPNDPSRVAPSIRWADGSELPETITVGSTPTQQVTIDAPNCIERVELLARFTNPEFAADAAALTEDDLCAVTSSRMLSMYGIPFGDAWKEQSSVSFGVDKILALIRDYEGEYTFVFTVTDGAGFTSEQTLRFIVGNVGPTIKGVGFDIDTVLEVSPEDGTVEVEINGKVQKSNEVNVKVHSDAGIDSLWVAIISEQLTPMLGDVGIPETFNLCTLDEDMVTKMTGFGFPCNEQVKGVQDLDFRISSELMEALRQFGGDHRFELRVADANGETTKAILLHVDK